MGNQVAILDVDDTLLNYTSAFHDWIYGSCLRPPRKNNQIDYGGVSDIFNETFHMRTLKPLNGAKNLVSSLHNNGFDIKIVSSFSNKYQVHQMRVDNLENIFGSIFSEYFFTDYDNGKENKRRVIKSQLNSNKEVLYFEDDFDIIQYFAKECFIDDIEDGNLKIYRVQNNWILP